MPTEGDALAALQRVFGADRGAVRWTDACRAAGLAAGRVTSAEQLDRALRRLAAEGGAAATVARSFEIRLRTYHRLAARAAALSAGDSQ